MKLESWCVVSSCNVWLCNVWQHLTLWRNVNWRHIILPPEGASVQNFALIAPTTHTEQEREAGNGCEWFMVYALMDRSQPVGYEPKDLIYTGQSQPHASCHKENKTIPQHEQANKQPPPAIQHFVALSTTATQMLGVHWQRCKSNAAPRTTWGMVQIISA